MTTLEENPTINAVQPALTPVRWIGTNGDWYDAANWSTGRVPTANDLVTIENTTRSSTYEITFSNGNPIYGGLNLLASNGGSLKLRGLTTFRGSSTNDIDIKATGNGSVIDLSDVTSLSGGRTLKVLNIDALQGGQINLSNVTRISGGTTEVSADGAGSLINLSRLTEFIDDDFTRSLIKTRNAGFINLAQVTKLEEVDLNSDNSVLYLERLTTYVGDNNVDAINGGQISLIRLNSVLGQILQLKATGTRSRIAISEQLDASEYLIEEISGGDVIVSNSSSGLNYAPFVLTAIPSQQTQENTAFNFTVPANTFTDLDPSDTSLIYTASLGDGGALPSWLSFNATTRTFSGTPNNSQVGRLNLLVRATDNDGASTSTRFNLDVINLNVPPVVSNPITDQNTAVGQNFNFTFANNTFTDEDLGDSLTYTATLENGSPLPSWLSFDATTRTFNGTTTNADVGTLNVRVTATDLVGTSVTDIFALNILDPTINNPPSVANAIADQSASEDQLYTFTVPSTTFSDPDVDDVLTYSATFTDGSPLPAWLTFDPATSTFSGTPTNADIPSFSITYSIRVTATDPENASVSDDFDLTLTNVNDAPSLAVPISDQGTIIDRSFSYDLPDNTFTDIDPGEILNYSASLVDGSPLPSWLTFDPISLTFLGTPSVNDYGALEISVIATDASGASVSDVFALNIDIDAAQYGASYPDLIPVYGYNLSGLREHYRDFGRSEGRNPDLFDEFRYVASNTDLLNEPTIFDPNTRFVNADGAAQHYIESGFNEGRSLTSFQSDQYIASYGDLISAFGYNLTAGSIHYLQFGIVEGRAADTFDEYRYLAGYNDLLDFYGVDVTGATQQYILNGSEFSVGSEGRDPLEFKPDIYIASYDDLIQALQPFNNDNYLSQINYGSLHYVIAGRAEGRERAIFNPASYLANNPDVAADPFYANDPTRHYLVFGYSEGRVV